MKKEIDYRNTSRAAAFELWMSSPMPMVTLTKTFDVSVLVKTAKRRCVKFNALLCWCIGRAASRVKEFYILPEQGKLWEYDDIAVNVIVSNRNGGINSCDIAFTQDLDAFVREYNKLTEQVADRCESVFVEGSMVVGTSAMIETEIDSIVNQYTDKFCNPMVMWGRYRKGWFKTTLPISFQFHHVQMDGGHAAHFLALLQEEMNAL